MPGRRRGGRLSTRGFRPPTDWGAVTFHGSLVAGVGGFDFDVVDVSTAMADAPSSGILADEYTLRRTRGVWLAYPAVWPNATPGIVEVAIGLGVANIEAVNANAVPSPLQESYWDGWFYRSWSKHQLPAQVAGTGPPFFLTSTGEDSIWTIDSKAMRKVADNVIFAAIALETDTGEAVEVNYSVDLRMLFSLTSR